MSEKALQTAHFSHKSAFLSRRQFIQLGFAAVGAAWAGSLVQSQLFPQTSGLEETKPVEIPLAELPVGGSKLITYGGSPAIVLRTPESIKAFSLICTHLGCTVQWQEAAQEFYCPCHDGRFDQFGEVISGPPPVPLEAIMVKVENDTIICGEA
jgi:cytochrome b6-f complex iron-sulfur subunit